nr:MobH family relaxase [Pseudomonas amygdali]
MMLKFFKSRKGTDQVPAPSIEGYLLPEAGPALLQTPRRQKLIENIWQRTSLSKKQFERLYLAPITRYASLVQQLPASENHHHSYPGGMLDHGLEIVAYALKMRQSMMLPVGATPETQAEQSEVWSAAIAYAALLHDIGKIAVDLHVELKGGALWHPWNGTLNGPYRVRYRKGRDYKLHNAAAGLLYAPLLGPEILDWLSGYHELWASLIYVLAGQYEHAGVLGDLVVRADQASVAQELGGNPTRATAAPKQSLQRKLVDGLRYLLTEELKLNQPEASDGWLTDEGLWLVSKTVSDRLRAYLLSQGVEGIPDKNSAVFNVLQDNGIAQVNAEGKAIWKATVLSQTGWKNTFTFLRLSPALIWDAKERPPSFLGSVTVEGEATQAVDAAQITQPGPVAMQLGDAPVVATTPGDAPQTAAHNDGLDAAGDHVDELLDLFGMSEPAPVIKESIPTVQPCHSVPDSESSGPVSQPRMSVQPAAYPSNLVVGADENPPSSAQLLEPSGADFGVTSTKKSQGQHFLDWVRMGVLTHKIVINDAKAKVHTVDGTAFLVTPEIFRRYSQEHVDVAKEAKAQGFDEDWRWVQRCFEKLGVHRKRSNGLNIWTCDIKGPRKSKNLKGYLLTDPRLLFNEVPYDNPSVALISTESSQAG